jgi:hypothetical protein
MQLQRKRHIKEKDEYFKHNGGLRLYDEMRSRQVHTVRVLTENEIFFRNGVSRPLHPKDAHNLFISIKQTQEPYKITHRSA